MSELKEQSVLQDSSFPFMVSRDLSFDIDFYSEKYAENKVKAPKTNTKI